MKRIAYSGIGLALAFGLLGLPASAQNQGSSNQDSSSDSLGSYARQIKKDPSAKPKARVYDNDNLPVNDKVSIIGQEPAASADTKTGESSNATTPAAAPAADASKSTTEGGAAKPEAKTEQKPSGKPKTAEEEQKEKEAAWKQWGDRIAQQKDAIELLTRELDVLQREYQIRAAAMYSDAGNRMRNEGNWDKQDAQYKQQIADKQKAVDDAKQKMDDIQEEARKAGVPSSAVEQ